MTDKMFAQLTKVLSPKRLEHSRGVSETAAVLAAKYGADVGKARLAGLLHDCARGMPSNILLQVAAASGIVVNDVEKREPMLLHAPVGAMIASRDFGVDDPEVLAAIRWHTTGGPSMALLDEIVFLADYIEPARSFPGVDRLRELAGEDLPVALLAAYDQTLSHLLAERRLIHPATVEGRNALLMKIKN
ncbi:bis(5'-nucleosyl)-tetraphosphatase (symmetrical) YqeK [Anaeroselena agilis]|uniref:bis(5'-nucleosyl)-tetraphosphatase (symmetrical) n=1 Tax=Anaeroselena agilis TaxID=3063788 RepID=A0ABU3NZK5_9FIRM|nr:bis(5'-nucleosyl)-tetraphosphatase (symmetrical) YqeK [Selenomonadales bacterium 4137-cl]